MASKLMMSFDIAIQSLSLRFEKLKSPRESPVEGSEQNGLEKVAIRMVYVKTNHRTN